MNKGLSFAALAVAGVVSLTACSGSSSSTTYYKSGPAGQVVDRDIENGRYELETKDAKGKKHEFYVTGSVYNDCYTFSYYPSCVKHVDSKQKTVPGYKNNKTNKNKNSDKSSKSKDKTSKSKSKGFSFGGTGKSSKKR